MTLFAEGLPHPRRIVVTADGAVLVVQQNTGQIIGLIDDDGDGTADRGGVYGQNFNQPFGLVFVPSGQWAGDLLMSDPAAIYRLPVATGGEMAAITAPGVFGPPQGHITRADRDPSGDRRALRQRRLDGQSCRGARGQGDDPAVRCGWHQPIDLCARPAQRDRAPVCAERRPLCRRDGARRDGRCAGARLLREGLRGRRFRVAVSVCRRLRAAGVFAMARTSARRRSCPR